MKKPDAKMFSKLIYPTAVKTAGDTLLYTLKRVNMEKNSYESKLFFKTNGETEALTDWGTLAGFWPVPDKPLVVYAEKAGDGTDESGEGEKEKGKKSFSFYCAYVNKAGEAAKKQKKEPILTLPAPVQDAVFFSESKALLLMEDADETEEEKGCTVVEQLPFCENGSGYLEQTRARIWLWQKGEELKPLTPADFQVEEMQASPCGNWVYYIGQAYANAKPAQISDCLFKMDTENFAAEDISIGANFRHGAFTQTDDGGLIVFASDMQAFGINQNPDIYRISKDGKTKKCIYSGGEYNANNSICTDVSLASGARPYAEKDDIYFISTASESSHIMRFNTKTGDITQVTKEDGLVAAFCRLNGKSVAAAMRGGGPMRLYDIDDSGAEAPVPETGGGAEDYEFSQPQAVSFINKGNEIRGWVIKPHGFKEGEKYPAILEIHGGPKVTYGSVLYHEMQYLAANGYGVFFCNPRGSNGRGDTFADVRGKMGDIDYDDLMGFTDTVLKENPWIDENRLGVGGGSYGGFMTNWIIGHTDRFKAAVTQRSISNWATMTLASDIGYFFTPDYSALDLWKQNEELWQMSPLSHVPKVKTPTLVMHSDADWRCGLSEALQMFAALQMHGVPSRLCVFHGESHELSRSGKPKNRVKRLTEMLRWYDEYLK